MPTPDRGINITGGATGNFIAGDNNTAGDVTVTTTGESTKDLAALLRELRTVVEANADKVPEADLVVHDIDSLATEAAKPEPKPAVARSVWGRIRDALAGTAATVTAVTTAVNDVNDAVAGVFGP
ncbi:hypothetical protein [Alloactinosynnema sp. L-07]|uniref:hypothetical protein n=1 Tax=Alloactinosynnema sp. L-07 TaxID=1653480 RepID=UPI00065EF002|nr:hypothetical protein [Alloactinosynnema sp. L-07]CRK59155.1 hypothetical protein [Alloactinosynnema sp. L-07]